MNGNTSRFVRLVVCLLALVSLAMVLTGQATKSKRHGIPLPTDWSHRHLIYSAPRTPEQAARFRQDPRFEQQWHRQNDRLLMANGDPAESDLTAVRRGHFFTQHPKMQRDWATTLTAGGTVGAGAFPAKFSFDTENADCTNDFVVFGTSKGLPDLSTASVVAYNNLYSGCGGTVPSVYWAHNSFGNAVTSPFFSLDGKQVAYAQTSGGFGELVIMKWAHINGASVSSPGAIAGVDESVYRACVAPCYSTVIFRDLGNSGLQDTISSAFYDYTHDIAWVGAVDPAPVGGGTSWLVKIQNVFSGGVPAEINTGGFPVALTATGILSSPIFDRISNQVFVGDSDGFLYRVNASSGAFVKSGRLDFGAGLRESPIVDVSAQKVYVFASSDGSVGPCGGVACAAVYALDTTFTTGATGTKATVGPSSATPNPMFGGNFDSTYYNSGNATGNLYVCGNTGGVPALYQIPISNGALPVSGLGTSVVSLGSTGTPGCSPITNVLNPNATPGPTERLYVGVQDHGLPIGCLGGGCLQSFPITQWKASTVSIPSTYLAGQQILDSNLNIEVVITGGTAGTTTPLFNLLPGFTTTDDTVTWLNQGPFDPSPAVWATGVHLPSERILGGGDLQASVTAGTSGATEPAWNNVVGGTTTDGTVTWVNVGPSTLAALPASGGTSGIIIDNFVPDGTLPGASQIYFSTLTDQVTCGAASNVGCAVQASQSALQ